MTQLILQRRELEDILKLLDKFECNYVSLSQSESTGIGNTLTATLDVTVNDEHGEFTVEITGIEDW